MPREGRHDSHERDDAEQPREDRHADGRCPVSRGPCLRLGHAQCRPQVIDEGLAVGVAVIGLLGQAPRDDGIDGDRELGPPAVKPTAAGRGGGR